MEYGRGGRKESDDLMLQLDSIIPGVLEPLGTCLHLSLSICTLSFICRKHFPSTSTISASSVTNSSPPSHPGHSIQVTLSLSSFSLQTSRTRRAPLPPLSALSPPATWVAALGQGAPGEACLPLPLYTHLMRNHPDQVLKMISTPSP